MVTLWLKGYEYSPATRTSANTEQLIKHRIVCYATTGNFICNEVIE